MFSQQGIDASGNISTRYEDFDHLIPTGGKFTPNILFNFKTGAGHMAAGKIIFSSTGSVIAKDLQLTGNSKFNLSSVSVDPQGKGEITELNSFVGDYDTSFSLGIRWGNDNPNAFIVGEVYIGRFVNYSLFSANINATIPGRNGDVRFSGCGYEPLGTGEGDGTHLYYSSINLKIKSTLEYI
ncbi:MAG: hypothetical protein RRY26_03330 [Cellulosilyticaceae bacterium]